MTFSTAPIQRCNRLFHQINYGITVDPEWNQPFMMTMPDQVDATGRKMPDIWLQTRGVSHRSFLLDAWRNICIVTGQAPGPGEVCAIMNGSAVIHGLVCEQLFSQLYEEDQIKALNDLLTECNNTLSPGSVAARVGCFCHACLGNGSSSRPPFDQKYALEGLLFLAYTSAVSLGTVCVFKALWTDRHALHNRISALLRTGLGPGLDKREWKKKSGVVQPDAATKPVARDNAASRRALARVGLQKAYATSSDANPLVKPAAATKPVAMVERQAAPVNPSKKSLDWFDQEVLVGLLRDTAFLARVPKHETVRTQAILARLTPTV